MNSGNTNLCDVNTAIKGKYAVTWNKHITGLSVYNEKAYILLDMIVKDSKSYEVGIMLSSGHVLWLSCTLLSTLDIRTLAEYVRRCGNIIDPNQIEGAVFDNIEDVSNFTKKLEQKYIWHILKK
jgi:hypothetical protein